MQRKRFIDIIRSIQIKEIAQPLGYMLVLSILYNLVYLFLSTRISNESVFLGVEWILNIISGIGFYWLCTIAWKSEKRFPIVKIACFQTLLFLMVSALVKGSEIFTSLALLFQILGVLCMVFLFPIQLIYFHGLTLNEKNYIRPVLKRHSKNILNYSCICLLIVLFVDSFFGGVFSIVGEMDACRMAQGMLIYANPMMDCMMTSFMASLYGVSIADVFVYVVLFIIIGLWYGVMYMNYIVYIQRKCLDDGTIKNKAHKKKNRTSK